MRIPMAYTFGDRRITEVELGRPVGAVLAETRRMAETGDWYSSMLAFISGSVKSISTDNGEIDEKGQIKNAIKEMPYGPNATFLATQIFLNLKVNDEIDQICECPKCHTEIIQEEPDRVRDLEVVYCDDDEDFIEIQLSEPVEIVNGKTKEVLVSIESIEMRQPTIGDCINAVKKYGSKDQSNLQYGIFLEALQAINSQPIDRSEKAKYGLMIFNKMDIEDLKQITEYTTKYGMSREVPKICLKCGKEFAFEVELTDFFASGIRGN